MAAALLVRRTAEAMKQAEARKQNVESAMQANAVDMVRVHCAVYMFDRFKDTLQNMPENLKQSVLSVLLKTLSSSEFLIAAVPPQRHFEPQGQLGATAAVAVLFCPTGRQCPRIVCSSLCSSSQGLQRYSLHVFLK